MTENCGLKFVFRIRVLNRTFEGKIKDDDPKF